MFVTIKRKTIIIALVIILAVVGIIVGTVLGVRAAREANANYNGKTVVIDAGHGGFDGGVVGVNTGVKESDINLAISQQLQTILQNRGYRVVMTRTTQDGLYGRTAQNRKMADMRVRERIINDASPDVVVSIHQNSFPSPNVRGPQVFFSNQCESSPEFASIMQEVLNYTLESDRLSKRGDFFILECSPYPSILIESGFLSNPEDEALLVTQDHQNKIATAIANGIHLFLFNEPPVLV